MNRKQDEPSGCGFGFFLLSIVAVILVITELLGWDMLQTAFFFAAIFGIYRGLTDLTD